jgi:hypothetical protein
MDRDAAAGPATFDTAKLRCETRDIGSDAFAIHRASFEKLRRGMQQGAETCLLMGSCQPHQSLAPREARRISFSDVLRQIQRAR